jgi:cellulose synthase/poly-beta-1,6-N-acetylglucosamine synthase-like glycosyltransferase
VEAISGAFMLVTRQALQDVGPLDEGYFMHCEDLDWCMRFREKGWQILFVPEAIAMPPQRALQHIPAHCRGIIQTPGHGAVLPEIFLAHYPMVLMWLVTGAVWGRFLLVAGLQQVRRWKDSKHHG